MPLQPTRKIAFLPLLHVGEGGRGDEVRAKKLHPCCQTPPDFV